MFEAFLVTTSTAGLRPLGSAAQRSFELVSETVRSRLGHDHARLFAEPVATEHGDRVDWYAPMAGAAVPLPDLPEDQQQAVRDRLGVLVADIRTEAERLGESADAQDQRLSEALANAIEIPDDSMVHVVRDADGALHPVLVHWAWLRDAQQSVRGVLTAMVPRPGAEQAAMAPAAGAASTPGNASAAWWWLILLGWLLLALMLGYILYLLIAPCGLTPGRLGYCPRTPDEVSAIPGEREVIEDEVARLQRELALLDRGCQPGVPILPAPPLPKTGPDKSVPDRADPSDKTDLSPEAVGRRLVARGAERGALNFALSWASEDDIDLAVICPGGQEISYKNRSDCGGSFDLDANVKRAQAVADPVENIVFDQVTPGLYKVRATLKGDRTEGEKPVTLHVLRQDGRSRSYSGTVSDKAPEWSLNISISR
ncbi:hypothetical protein [Sedimentitalea nanhaiensis]|uniref:Uncharacterized protein n=1 Tax=Sedimentitalea nanhaiensis TaxID=999627 RepID=A0A1I6ZWG3_9RHOB|nr:hypothetical protein [Sedimentitalea nanhaiensis]SFT67033.1 hypothetical protein SAMN05216236_10526 [Sedimentitalea nanhaiensis]